LCLLDYPREDICDQSTWGGAERGFVRAAKQTDTKAAVLATFSDTISETVTARLMKEGVAMLAGIDAGVAGIQAAVDVGTAWSQLPHPPLLTCSEQQQNVSVKVLNEAESKDFLARCGVPVPLARVVYSAREAVEAAESLGYPVVVKTLGVAHKTEVGGVKLNLGSPDQVSAAVMEMSGLCESFLIEKMVDGVVAELIVGVACDEQFGPYLLIGGGGVLVEMMKDSASLLIPTSREQVLYALGQLKCAPLLTCFRGLPPADLNAAAEVILSIADMVEKDPAAIIELDINPLLLLADGQGVVAADALVSLNTTSQLKQSIVERT
jgi:acyl-CoA synthetase (NDP forming)